MFDPSKLKTYPNSCGVYLMKDSENNVLYVGKAKNIRARLRQYFSLSDERKTIPLLLPKITFIETILVQTEKEALLLENTLIKKHRPKFNILLKDDKTYVSLLLTDHHWPMLKLYRKKTVSKKFKGKLFGPYTNARAARQTLELLLKIFPLRQCSDAELTNRSRPCILYEIKKCVAPCVNYSTKKEYDQLVQGAKQLLEGRDKLFIKGLQNKMKHASEKLEFEKAQKYLDLIEQIKHVLQIQHVDLLTAKNSDVIGFHREEDSVMITTLEYREGKLTGSKSFHFSFIASSNEEILSSFLLQYYKNIAVSTILIPISLKDQKMIEEILSSKKKVSLICPKKGEKKKLIEIATHNAKAVFEREKKQLTHKEKLLFEMEEKLKLTHFPKKIICVDIAHLSQKEPVGAIITYINGSYEKSQTKLFKIKDQTLGDAKSIAHVLDRYLEKEQEKSLPDLIIVDGAKAQLGAALKVLDIRNIASIDIVGLTKEKGLHTKGLTKEKIYLPSIKEPIILSSHSPLLFLLQKIRDEAHRVAITFHKKRREKSLIKSSLDDIPGIGPKKRKILLQHFGSIEQIKKAGPKELEKVKGLSEKDRKALLKYLNKS